MKTRIDTLHSATMTILVATAMAGAMIPASSAWACGPYRDFVEVSAPRPELAQTWTCSTPSYVNTSEEQVVDVMQLSTSGGEDASWELRAATIPAKDSTRHEFEGPSIDSGTSSWSHDVLQIRMEEHHVMMRPSPFSDTVYADVLAEDRDNSTNVQFKCLLTE